MRDESSGGSWGMPQSSFSIVAAVLAVGCGGGGSDSKVGSGGSTGSASTTAANSGGSTSSSSDGTSTTAGNATGAGGATGGAGASGVPVGGACTPSDEVSPQFGGYGVTEVNIDTASEECASGICLTNHFQGRTTCPYGQAEASITTMSGDDPARCRTADGQPVAVPVEPQLLERRAEDTVHCSCRCDGPEEGVDYCACPDGMECVPLVEDLGFGDQNDVAGSYCIKDGMAYDPAQRDVTVCDQQQQNCGNAGQNPL